MKLSRRLAAFDVLGVLAIWVAITALTGSWEAQRASILSFLVLLSGAVVVFWRVSTAYAAGPVAISRAITEGFVSGVAFAFSMQVLFWSFLVLSGDAPLSAPINFAGIVNLMQQASYSGAVGAVLGAGLWGANQLALRRAVP